MTRNSEQSKVIIGIFAGIAFVIGLGIGVQLYAVTTKSVPNDSDYTHQESYTRMQDKIEYRNISI